MREPPIPPGAKKEIDLLRDLSCRLAFAGRLDEARSLAEGVVALWPDYYLGYALLGAIWEQCGERGRARQAYERAVARHPADAASILNLGRLQIAAGEVGRGLDNVRRAWTLERRKKSELAQVARQVLDHYGL